MPRRSQQDHKNAEAREAVLSRSILVAVILLFACRGPGAENDALLTTREPVWVPPPAPIATYPAKDGIGLRLSPDAKRFAVFDDQEGSDVAFTHDRTLHLSQTESGVELTDGHDWTVHLPMILLSRLEVGGQMWAVSGLRPHGYTFVRYVGRIGVHAYEKAPAPPAGKPFPPPWVPGSANLLLARGPELHLIGNGRDAIVGRTALTVRDTFWLPDVNTWGILGGDEDTTYITTYDTSLRKEGRVEGKASALAVGRGARIALLGERRDVIVWNLRSGKAMRIACAKCEARAAAFAENAVGVLRRNGDLMEVAIYPLAV